MKRIILTLLAMAMIFTSIGITAAASEDDVYLIKGAENAEKFGLFKEEEVVLNTDESSRMVFSSLNHSVLTKCNLSENSMPSDWSVFESLCMWVYCPKITNGEVKLQLNNGEASKDGCFYYVIKADWENEWRLLTIPLSAMSKWSDDYHTPTLEAIETMFFECTGANGAPASDTVLYIDSMWLTKDTIGNIYKNEVIFTDFEDRTAGSEISTSDILFSVLNTAEKPKISRSPLEDESVSDEEADKTAELKADRAYNQKLSYYFTEAQKQMIENAGKVKTTFDVVLEDYVRFMFTDESIGCVFLEFHNDGYISVMGQNAGSTQINKLYKIEFEADKKNSTMSISIDGKKVADNLSYDAKYGVNVIPYMSQWTKVEKCGKHAYIDNWGIYVPDEFENESVSMKDGACNVGVKGHSFTATYNKRPAVVPDFRIYDMDGNESGIMKSSLNGTSIKSVNNTLLEPETGYYSIIPGSIADVNGQTAGEDIYVYFTTAKAGLYIEGKKLAPDSFNTQEAALEVQVGNNSDTEKTAIVCTCLYDENNRLVKLDSEAVTVPAGGIADVRKTTALESSVRSIYTFVYDKETNILVPESVVMQTAEGSVHREVFDEGGKTSIILKNVSVKNDNVAVSASLKEANIKNALLCVSNAENIAYISPVTFDENGNLEINLALKSGTEAGVYNLTVTAMNAAEKAETSFNYISDELSKQIVGEINSSKSADDVKNTLAKYSDLLNLTADMFNDNAYECVLSGRNYSELYEITDRIILSNELLKKVNNADFTKLSDLIVDNADIILAESDYKKEFLSKSENDKRKIVKQIYTSAGFISFRAISEKIDDAIKNSSKSSSGSPGGAVKKTYKTDIYAGPNTGVETAPGSDAVKDKIKDIEKAGWAREYVEYLADNNIISGDENGCFNPESHITREQFLKMLTEVCGIAGNKSSVSFKDVDASAWYAPYVSAAYNANIVKGISDELFGIGDKITRQDMAVMIYRTGGFAGTENAEVKPFTDEAQIADYAKTAVSVMKNEGIINGMEDGSFAPAAYATKAEAAKILYMVARRTK